MSVVWDMSVCCWFILGGARMAFKLSIARRCSLVLSSVLSVCTAVTNDCKQWIMQSSVVSVGIFNVCCRNVTVSDTTTACVSLRMSL